MKTLINNILLLITLTLLSCGAKDISQKRLEINPAMAPLVQQFALTAKELNKPVVIDNLIVQFVSGFADPQVLGICDSGSTITEINYLGQKTIKHETPTISIKKSYFDNVTAAAQHELLFHELGHCILHLDHVTGYDASNDRFYSIMNPYEFSSLNYVDNFDYYMKQLFHVISINQNPNVIGSVSLAIDPLTGVLNNSQASLALVDVQQESIQLKIDYEEEVLKKQQERKVYSCTPNAYQKEMIKKYHIK